MSTLNVKKNTILVENPVEEFLTTADKSGGYVVVISKDNIAQSDVFHHTHDKTLEKLLNQIGNSVPTDNDIDCWSRKQSEGFVLMRMIKDLSIVYMPEYLNDYQLEKVTDVQNQIESYETNNNSNVTICVSDMEQGNLYFNQIAQLKEYLESKKIRTK